ncbi:MAG: hypothetical protein SPL86_07935 [Succiniclasticum sp.]|uniref:hypothetical protein n=1 Tax=Succiniclasticum sp. TaxID=2775030 RepID=UPI002A918A82|nr:hypothetical protein [Succiniclasticum sp.]MDY6291397.1 hypothetical protein [Succiniclasticum sp.]
MRKLLSLIAGLVLCLGLTTSVFAEGASLVASEQLDAVETALYGTHQSSSMMERMESLEDDIYGAPEASRNILDRIQSTYDYICGTNGGNGSFMQKLNAVDSRFNAQITSGPAKTRIEDMENIIFGQVQGGSLNQRLDRLVETAYNGGQVPVESVVLPKDSLVKIEFTSPLSSRDARPGDPVKFRVADNLYVNDVLVLSKGATGVAEVAKVVQPRSFGRDARIDVKFSHVFSVDGNKVPVYIGKLAKQEAKTAAGAAGATIGGMIVLGPIGAIGGAFVTGQSIVIPEGSTTYVQVVEDQTISGIVYQEASATGAAK